MMLVLTGEKGSGKTTLVRKAVSGGGVLAQGFLSVKEVDRGVVTGISLLILPEHEIVPMASTTPMETDMFTKRFYFYPGVFDRVNRRFLDIRPDVPFVFDEFGLLEMEGKGHYPVFRTIVESSHPSLIVVRRELKDHLVASLGRKCGYQIVDMDTPDQRTAHSLIASFLQAAKGV